MKEIYIARHNLSKRDYRKYSTAQKKNFPLRSDFEEYTYKERAGTSIKRWRYAIETKHNNPLPIGVTFPACRLRKNRVVEVVLLKVAKRKRR